MGFVTLGMFIAFAVLQPTESFRGAALGVEGAMVQMVSHGFISGALFLCVGVLYDRTRHREIDGFGGIAAVMPNYAVVSFLAFFAALGLPGDADWAQAVTRYLRLWGRFS